MRIELLNDTSDLENNKASVDMLFNRINSILEDEQYAFDCMEIDGNLVYKDHYDYIIGNLDDIKEVKVIIITIDELNRNILASTIHYIQGALPEISKLSDEFYRGPEQGSWAKMQQFLEGIQWINSGAEVIANSKNSYGGMYEYKKVTSEMGEKLAELTAAVKNSDMVLIGDLLSYEMIPVLEAIKDTANEIVNSEVDKDASN